MKTALRVVALVLLTVLCVLLVWNIVEYIAYLNDFTEYIDRYKSNREYNNFESMKPLYREVIFVVFNMFYSTFAIFACVYFMIKKINHILRENITVQAKATEVKQEELLRLKKAKKIAKLQEKLNKYKESE